jgi:hypothetical protein
VTARQLVAYALIGLGALALLARVGPGSGWLWVALVAAGFLAAYRRERTYAFLVLGAVLAGTALGLLLEGAWGWHGAFLMSLGAGFLLIDRAEPRPSHWPIYPAAVLVGVGLVYWLFRAGVLQSLWFPFLLIIAGIFLLRRRSDWVKVDDETSAERSDEPPAAGADAPSAWPAAPGAGQAGWPDDAVSGRAASQAFSEGFGPEVQPSEPRVPPMGSAVDDRARERHWTAAPVSDEAEGSEPGAGKGDDQVGKSGDDTAAHEGVDSNEDERS